MYCPRCSTQNADDTKFCRACGSNLSLVPQALTGRLPEQRSGRRHRRRERDNDQPSLEHGITKAFMGAGFLLAAVGAFFFAPAGRIWWFWLLIPAFLSLGRGIAEIVASMRTPPGLPPISQPVVQGQVRAGELPPSNDTVFPPPSVTEQTTRQLDPTTDPYRYRERERH